MQGLKTYQKRRVEMHQPYKRVRQVWREAGPQLMYGMVVTAYNGVTNHLIQKEKHKP